MRIYWPKVLTVIVQSIRCFDICVVGSRCGYFWFLLDGFWYDRTEVKRRKAWKKCGQSDSIAAVLFCFMSIFMVLRCMSLNMLLFWYLFSYIFIAQVHHAFMSFLWRSPFATSELNLPGIQNATFCCLNRWVDLYHVSYATCCHLSSVFQLESCHAAVAWTPEWRAWKDFVNLRSHGGKTAMTTRISRENNYTIHSVLIRDDFGHYFFTTKIAPQKTLSEQESCFQPVIFSTG